MIKLLLFSSLFPNSQQPSHGIFVENRLRKLQESGEIEVKVIAPVPWFPFKNSRFGLYSKYARVPYTEERHNNQIIHPRYKIIPKAGMNFAPKSMAKATLPVIKKIITEGYNFDIIDAHYFYPDGIAATIIGEELGKPVVITSRGTDINLIPQYKKPRKMIMESSKKAAAMITVCQALKTSMVEMGIEADKITPLRNGVDLKFFTPTDNRESLRSQLGMNRITALSVGHLIDRKGHHLIIDAMKSLASEPIDLIIIGDGEKREELKKQVLENGLEQRIKFTGALDQQKLRDYYRAADILILASSREGWANVLLESMACGTPVVASNVWGTPEVVNSAEAGILMKSLDAQGVTNGVKELLTNYPDRVKTRTYAEGFSWDQTTEGQLKIFRRLAL